MIGLVIDLYAAAPGAAVTVTLVVVLSGYLAFQVGRDVWNGRLLKLAAILCAISVFNASAGVLGGLVLWLLGAQP